MINYKIVQDEIKLKEFISWLPDLGENEKYFIALFARKKYSDSLIKSNDKTQLKRFTSCKEKLFEKIKQLECAVGSYKLKGMDVPQESLVLYLNPNPRDLKKAAFQLIKKCVDLVQNDNNGFNIHAEALSSIQRTKGKSHFCDFDIDDKSVDLSLLKDILPDGSYNIVETRGGFHILVDTRLTPKTKWHQEIRKVYNVDQVGDQLLPVPGCCQGGFVPRFVKI